MTICVGVAVYDGIVFAADSAATLVGIGPNGQPAISNVYRNGNKVFNLVRGLPIVAMTCGMGNFGRAPIAVLTKDLRAEFASGEDPMFINPDNYTVKQIAEKAFKFFESKYSAISPTPPTPHSFSYWIGGYSSNSEAHELWKIEITNGKCLPPAEAITPGDCGLVWGGNPEAINRLVTGYSPNLHDVLVKAGMDDATATQVLALAQRALHKPLVEPAMPIQDAIELADFLVETTKRFVRYLPGADTVGGETDIAVVTRHERFKWVKRKHYYPTHLNPLETDHV